MPWEREKLGWPGGAGEKKAQSTGEGAQQQHLKHKFLTEQIPVLHPAPVWAVKLIL